MENVGFYQPALLTAYPVCYLGIKPAGSEVGDSEQLTTPEKEIEKWSNYLVIYHDF